MVAKVNLSVYKQYELDLESTTNEIGITMTSVMQGIFNRTLRKTWKIKLLATALSLVVFTGIMLSWSIMGGQDLVTALISLKELKFYYLGLVVIAIVLPAPS